jgi:hypothetical protein
MRLTLFPQGNLGTFTMNGPEMSSPMEKSGKAKTMKEKLS